MVDADAGGLEALGRVAGQALQDALVDPALEAVLRAVAEEAQDVLLQRGLAGVVADAVDDRQRKPSRQVRRDELAQLRRVLGDEGLVGVEEEDPVAGGGVEADVARGGEVVVPGVLEDLGAVLAGDVGGAVLSSRCRRR